MKKLLSIAIGLVGVLAVPAGLVQASHNSNQYSYVAAITDVQKAGTQPVPTTVTWVESVAVEDGDMILDHYEVVVTEDDIVVATLTVPAEDRSVTLSKTNVPDMKVYSRYGVRVDEVYTDATTSEGFENIFYTAPPKLKNIRVKNKTLELDDTMTITLKWRQPANLQDDYIYYDYKIKRFSTGSLVKESYEWGSNFKSAIITGLPLQKMKIRVRAREDYHGAGQWSKWKTFTSVQAE